MGVAAVYGVDPSAGAWIVATLVGAMASLPVIASTVGARSAGAVDDASGVVTVLRAAAMLPREMAIGIVLTSAEELGMAGARAFAARRGRGVALNVDGVDDRGTVVCMVHRRVGRARAAVLRAARAVAMAVRTGPTIPGLLTDGVALANAGWDAVTLSRGTLATLSRIHRRADDLSALRGDGIDDMARLLAAAAREID
jgi:Zn-dependent M28 family amino/carboxypeptidase